MLVVSMMGPQSELLISHPTRSFLLSGQRVIFQARYFPRRIYMDVAYFGFNYDQDKRGVGQGPIVFPLWPTNK